MWEMGLYSAVAPLMLLLLSSVWRYPAVLEEVVKWGILRHTANSVQLTVKQGALVGLVFGLSEAILFTTNAWAGGQWGAMLSRLLLTAPMHIVTATIIVWGVQKKIGWVGLILAMVVHGMFNYWVK